MSRQTQWMQVIEWIDGGVVLLLVINSWVASQWRKRQRKLRQQRTQKGGRG